LSNNVSRTKPNVEVTVQPAPDAAQRLKRLAALLLVKPPMADKQKPGGVSAGL
jgi:hypothetical protein